MPNWCDNKLEICGSDADVDKFMKENMEDGKLSFAKAVPEPEYEGRMGWNNNWRIENWGTKWEPDMRHDYKEGDNTLYFDTAWSPPDIWLETVANKYPNLCFSLRYAEGGCDFSGFIKYLYGELVRNEEGDYGKYYGEQYCENCEECINWDCCDNGWNRKFDMCTNCFDKACKTIKSAVRTKKIEKLPQKLACMRMGRNPIVDNYLMRKVFIPRLNECVA